MIRAKFKLVAQEMQFSAMKLTFRPEYDTSIPEDKRFYDATPSGEFWMVVNNPIALQELKLGEQYYLDLIPV